MWIFQNDSFLSIVAHREQPGRLLVRSRVEGDIQRALPEVEVFEDASADYRFRAVVTPEQVKAAMSAAVDKITYANFKGSVADAKRGRAYLSVWSVMASAYDASGQEP